MRTLINTRLTEKSKHLTFYENTVLLSLNFDGYNIEDPKNDFDAIQETFKIFMSEYGHFLNIVEYGTKNNLFAEYLKGLPPVCSVPYMNSEILKNAQKDGFNLMTEQAEDNFLSMYWLNLANAFFKLKENL